MNAARPHSDAAIWHDVECAGYDADLPLWRSLASRCGGPVLDVGAGTGRVTLDLARHGHEVTALDRDGELLEVLSVRARGLPVEVVEADAREFRLHATFALCVVPMQTAQLLGVAGRAAFLGCARRHLRSGGVLAAAIAEDLPGFEPGDSSIPPLPDVRERDGWVYSSLPVATRNEKRHIVLERRREAIAPHGGRTVSEDVVRLDRVSVRELENEARAAGFRPGRPVSVPPTEEHVGSEVAILRVP